jgi:hypothetical protein
MLLVTHSVFAEKNQYPEFPALADLPLQIPAKHSISSRPWTPLCLT